MGVSIWEGKKAERMASALEIIAIANTNWNRLAKKAGIKPKELYKRL